MALLSERGAARIPIPADLSLRLQHLTPNPRIFTGVLENIRIVVAHLESTWVQDMEAALGPVASQVAIRTSPHPIQDLTKPTGCEHGLTGQPSRICRRQKNGDGRNIIWLCNASQRGLRLILFLEVASNDSGRMDALRLHDSWVYR